MTKKIKLDGGQEISKQQQTAITQAKLVKQIETIRQKEIDKQAAQLEGEALAVRKQSEFEGIKQARILEADGEASYLAQTGKARGEALAAEGQGKAMGILKEAEAMQKYDNIGQSIKKLVVEQAIQTAYADALKQAEIKAYLTGKPEGGIMGLLSPQGGASLGTALATYKDTKQESNGLMDLLGNIGIGKDTVKDFISGLGINNEPTKKEEKKSSKKGGE